MGTDRGALAPRSMKVLLDMVREYAVRAIAPERRSQYWTDAVSRSLLPMRSVFLDEAAEGVMKNWAFGPASLTYFRSDPVIYRRERDHLAQDTEEQLLVTFCYGSEILFTQDRATLRCAGNRFLLERGHLASEFVQPGASELLVLKLPAELLRQRVRSIDRFSGIAFDATTGMGGLLSDTLRALPRRLKGIEPDQQEGIARAILDLLSLTIEADPRALGSRENTVRAGHLARAEAYIGRHLANRTLTPESVAAACGISVRYLHELFQATGISVGSRIRTLRLDRCDAELRDPTRRDGVAEIAYRWGYADPAQFSRHYKAAYGITAREARVISPRDRSRFGASAAPSCRS